MRKSIFLLLILVFSSFTTSAETITISGQITNTENGTITIKGASFDKEIKLDADGTFAENITIAYDGIYSLETGKNTIPLYLSKGTKLSLSADDKTFLSSLKYSGKGSVENQYLANKAIITSQITDKELYKLDETEFLNKLTEIKKSITIFYKKIKFSDSYYQEKEAINIYYFEQKHLFYYKNYRSYLTGLRDIKVSDQFPKLDDSIDLDNETDYLFSNEYKLIAIDRFNENLRENSTSLNTETKKIQNIKALKSQSLKNQLIKNNIYDITTENPNYKNSYTAYISITNDPELIKNLTVFYNNAKAVEMGKPSPKFDYENHKGGKTSLESLKGKYVYIDIWATWCGPCRQEIPSLQKVEEQYKDKNIVFVSISIDAEKDHDKWSKFVTEKKLGGIQLLADKALDSEFIQAYGITAIPRFILIDPNGNIVNSQAPRPSETALIDLFNTLKI
ncbi:TlpA family protein disulfide reductase [Flavobacterium sp. ACAM 123]|uniref:TlpA family protein disulfide reductase n=1 Tax=Flavobacterium sp. ACAM 123 TaxID=1189620 RepID=UPI0002D5D95C|nr:TlpA disulfide reductase family protein [Flavobacterium sp. ACAM 123]